MKGDLYPDFLKGAREYEQAQRLWQAQWEDLIAAAGQTDLWKSPWIDTTFANGTPCRDGNPIFSAINRKERLGIRVIQLQPGEVRDELSHWTDQFGHGRKAIKELVIACVLTDQTLHQATALMKDWLSRSGRHSSPPVKRRTPARKK